MEKGLLEGWKKIGVLATSVTALPLVDIPDKWIWPLVALIGLYLIGQSAVDAVKAWKGSK